MVRSKYAQAWRMTRTKRGTGFKKVWDRGGAWKNQGAAREGGRSQKSSRKSYIEGPNGEKSREGNFKAYKYWNPKLWGGN